MITPTIISFSIRIRISISILITIVATIFTMITNTAIITIVTTRMARRSGGVAEQLECAAEVCAEVRVALTCDVVR